MLQHWLARIMCLIILPVMVFLISYWMHFRVARIDSGHNHFMSDKFKSALVDKNSYVRSVYYGSTINLKNQEQKSFLHSNIFTYPLEHSGTKKSSGGQQVSGHYHKDHNNDWIILPKLVNPSIDYQKNPRIAVKDGDTIRLLHSSTQKFLLAHDMFSPLTRTNREVTAIGINSSNPTQGRYYETLWTIRIKDGGPKLKTLNCEFELTHLGTGSNLLTSNSSLPKWGFGQLEMSTARASNEQTLWFIDRTIPLGGWTKTENETLEEAIKPRAVISFFAKFIEQMIATLDGGAKNTNNSSDLIHPIQWPFMFHGIDFWHSKDNREKIFLLGNPFAWYISILSLPCYIAMLLIDLLSKRRGSRFFSQEQRSFLYNKGGFFLLCYAMHYLPFFLVGRALDIYHYLPCYMFNTLVFTSLVQILSLRYKILQNPVVISIFCSLVIGMFLRFACFTYGINHHREYFRALEWMSTWNFTD